MPHKQPGTLNWGVSWTDASGTRHRKTSGTTDHAEACRIEAALRSPGETVAGVIDHYLQTHTGNRARERDLFAARAILSGFPDQPIPTLTPRLIEAYKASRGVSPGTLRKELSFLSRCIRFYTLSTGTPLPNILPQHLPKKPEPRIRWITREEAARLIASCDPKAPHLPVFIRLALATAMRKSELLDLDWSRVDLDHRVIHLAPGDQKSGKHGTVPLNGSALAALAELDSGAGKVFPVAGIRRSWATACRRAGIRDFHIHDLRHTACAWMVQAGVPIRHVMEAMRHADIRTTMGYAHLAPQAAREALSALDGTLTWSGGGTRELASGARLRT